MDSSRFARELDSYLTRDDRSEPMCGCGNELHTYDLDVCGDCAVAEMEQDERLARAETARAANVARLALARTERAVDALTRTLLTVTDRGARERAFVANVTLVAGGRAGASEVEAFVAATWRMLDRAALVCVPGMLRREGYVHGAARVLADCDSPVHDKSAQRAINALCLAYATRPIFEGTREAIGRALDGLRAMFGVDGLDEAGQRRACLEARGHVAAVLALAHDHAEAFGVAAAA